MAENKSKISHEWTDDDRLTVIANIAYRLNEEKINPKAAAQTIMIVVVKMPEFLEANRKQIMKDAGLEP
jgi:hypothetical protein